MYYILLNIETLFRYVNNYGELIWPQWSTLNVANFATTIRILGM